MKSQVMTTSASGNLTSLPVPRNAGTSSTLGPRMENCLPEMHHLYQALGPNDAQTSIYCEYGLISKLRSDQTHIARTCFVAIGRETAADAAVL